MKIDQYKMTSCYPEEQVTIRVMLPKDYEESGRKYPVAYVLDGQSLFSENDLAEFPVITSCANLDTYYDAFSSTLPQVIVVAVNSLRNPLERTASLGPDMESTLKLPDGREIVYHGKGRLFPDWFVNQVKALVDRTYRTLPDAENTALVGFSSTASGALLTALYYPELCSRLAMFGSAVDFWSTYFYDAVRERDMSYIRYYFNAVGTEEIIANNTEKKAIAANRQLFELMLQSGVRPENAYFFPIQNMDHRGETWNPYIADALRWLFQDSVLKERP